jgi:hypothetical protein
MHVAMSSVSEMVAIGSTGCASSSRSTSTARIMARIDSIAPNGDNSRSASVASASSARTRSADGPPSESTLMAAINSSTAVYVPATSVTPMPRPIRHVLVESADTAQLVQFWSVLLHLPVADDMSVSLGGDVALRFAATDEPKQVKNRLHLDLASTSAEHQADVVRIARDLGAQPVDVGQTDDVPWVVLADPGGNEFCVLEPRDEYRGIGPVAAVVFDALDPPAQAEFWAELTGLPVTRSHPQYASLRQEGRFWVEFIRVDTPKRVRNRVHLVLSKDDGLPQTDPEGNEILSR